MSKRSGCPLIKEAVKKAKREEARLTGEEKFNDIVINGERIMPTNMKKYAGSIKKSRKRWQIVFASTTYKGSAMRKTLEEAQAYQREVSTRERT